MHHCCRFLCVKVGRTWGRGGSLGDVVAGMRELWDTIDVDLGGYRSKREWVGGPDDNIWLQSDIFQ
jgi:hypothetical protein